jgi:hypothetical protein
MRTATTGAYEPSLDAYRRTRIADTITAGGSALAYLRGALTVLAALLKSFAFANDVCGIDTHQQCQRHVVTDGASG